MLTQIPYDHVSFSDYTEALEMIEVNWGGKVNAELVWLLTLQEEGVKTSRGI